MQKKNPDYHAKTNEIKSEIPNIAGLVTTVALSAIYFYVGFLSQTLTIHKTTGEVRGP